MSAVAAWKRAWVVEHETRNVAVIRPSPQPTSNHFVTSPRCIHLTVLPTNLLSHHSICASERKALGFRYSPTSPMDELRIVQFGTPVGKCVACWTSSSPARIFAYIHQTLSILRGEMIRLCEHNVCPNRTIEHRRLHQRPGFQECSDPLRCESTTRA